MSTIVCFSPVPGPVLGQWLIAQSGQAELQVVSVDEASGSQWEQAAAEAEVALGDYTFRHSIDDALLDRLPRLRFVQQPSVGYQHIDLDACRRRGILVANTPGVNSAAVAEQTVMVVLALLRRLVMANAITHQGGWAQHELMWEHGIYELAGKTCGIVGFGSVGREVAKRLSAFDVELLYFDPIRASDVDERRYNVSYKPLDHLLRRADVVSLHVPLTEQTRGLIGAPQLALMKFTALLINVARGECVDEQALADRIRAKKLAGAALDVFSEEPISPRHPLLGLENVILTPHTAGATNEVRERVVHMSVENLVRVLRGDAPQFVLNSGAARTSPAAVLT